MTTELASWRDGPIRSAISDFVGRVTDASGPEFVPQPARVAVFDNDGTLWTEKPLVIQLDFTIQRFAEMVRRNRRCGISSPTEPPTRRISAGWAPRWSSTTAATTAISAC